MSTFSERHNYSSPDADITIREDAPEVLRGAVVAIAGKAGIGYETLRKEVCGALGVAPDTRGNWSEPNVIAEVQHHLEECEWFEVYDVIESIAASLQGRPLPRRPSPSRAWYSLRPSADWQPRIPRAPAAPAPLPAKRDPD